MKHEMDDGINRKERVKETAEIFTPSCRIQEIFTRLNISKSDFKTKTFLDPTCGNGQFLVELAKMGVPFRNMYGVELQNDNIEVAIRRLKEFETSTNKVTDLNIINHDALTYNFRFGDIDNIKFNYILGNPPYQNGAKNLYDKMIMKFLTLDYDVMTMIIPNRYMVGGRGLDKFREYTLNLNNIKEIVEYPDDFEVFPSVWIRGGVQFITFDKKEAKETRHIRILNGETIQDVNRKLNTHDILIRNIKDEMLLNELEKLNLQSITNSIPKKGFDIASNFTDFKGSHFENSTKLYHKRQLSKSSDIKGVGYIEKVNFDKKYRVITRAMTSNNSKRGVNPVFIIEPDAMCSSTYKILGEFNSLKEAEEFSIYMSTKIVRYLVNIRKISVAVNTNTFKFVPEFAEIFKDGLSNNFTAEELNEKIMNTLNLSSNMKELISSTIIDREVNHVKKEQFNPDINKWVDRVKWVD